MYIVQGFLNQQTNQGWVINSYKKPLFNADPHTYWMCRIFMTYVIWYHPRTPAFIFGFSWNHVMSISNDTLYVLLADEF